MEVAAFVSLSGDYKVGTVRCLEVKILCSKLSSVIVKDGNTDALT
jgi:hypothetical protein